MVRCQPFNQLPRKSFFFFLPQTIHKDMVKSLSPIGNLTDNSSINPNAVIQQQFNRRTITQNVFFIFSSRMTFKSIIL